MQSSTKEGKVSASAVQPPSRFDRAHTGDRPPDNRTPAQRDRDRILFTSAFRRLSAVTQVVSPGEGHIFHSRLTHSLEVAQVGRRLAEKLLAESPSFTDSFPISPDVVEAACLAHDLGHPPFGHIAEKCLDTLATKKGLPDGFEGNAQSFRIVTKLAFRSQSVTGLNLTRATLNAMLKYPWLRGTAGKKNRKWGAYESEESDFKFARALSPVGEEKQSVEAAIMDWADDITYSVHDMEDFYRGRLIPVHVLANDQRERERFYAGAEKRLSRVEGIESSEMSALIKSFDTMIVSLPLANAYEGSHDQRADLRTVTASLINRYIRDTHLQEQESNNPQLSIPAGYKREVKMLKELTWFYVINNPSLATQQYGQRKLVKDLFNVFHEISENLEEFGHVFPISTFEELDATRQLTDVTLRQMMTTRTIVDLISGMTERHAVNMHQRITGVSLGSVLDYIER